MVVLPLMLSSRQLSALELFMPSVKRTFFFSRSLLSPHVFLLLFFLGLASGLGGGGFMLVYNTPTRGSTLFDFRETAPGSATPNMFTSNPSSSTQGGLAVGIPGEIRGYETAHSKYGSLPWASLFLPAIGWCLFFIFSFLPFFLSSSWT